MGDVIGLGQMVDFPEWYSQARCAEADPEAWFPEKGRSTAYAKLVCRMCEVRPRCLEFALETRQPYGVWGGASERERRKILREREKTAEAAGEAA